jgi:hypothetical protein
MAAQTHRRLRWASSGRPPLLVLRLARGDRMRAPADAHISPTQHALLLVPALASASAHAADFRRRYLARPRSRVQCCCAALADGRAGRGGHCCCSGRESTCSQLVRAAAPPHVFACRRALRTMCVRRARPAGQQVTAAALLCGAVFPGVLFPRARDAWTRYDRRAHTHATSLRRLHCPTAPKLSAAQHTTRAAPPATT